MGLPTIGYKNHRFPALVHGLARGGNSAFGGSVIDSYSIDEENPFTP